MPESLKQLFINVFSRLKLRVLWKWKSDIPGLPKHIKISKWLPQQDVLGKHMAYAKKCFFREFKMSKKKSCIETLI